MTEVTVCREFGPGEMIRCPAPPRPGQSAGASDCGVGLGWVGQDRRAVVCLGKEGQDSPDKIQLCPHNRCRALVAIRFFPAHAHSA